MKEEEGERQRLSVLMLLLAVTMKQTLRQGSEWLVLKRRNSIILMFACFQLLVQAQPILGPRLPQYLGMYELILAVNDSE